MWDTLLSNLPTILIILVAGIICGADLIKAKRVWQEERDKKQKVKDTEKQEKEEAKKEHDAIMTALSTIMDKLNALDTRMGTAETRLADLTESDMNDIRAWIVEQYHKFYNHQGWIDAFSADTIDRRHRDYKKEGGNSYIDELVARLHKLPMDPEEEKQTKNKED